jgi:histidinol-phosphatase (PHP family)
MVLSAIDKGLDVLGIVTHAYIPFHDFYTIKPDKIGEFQSTIRALAKKYAGKIKVLCGAEGDPVSPMSYEGFDYVIGSNHYFYKGDFVDACDFTPKHFSWVVNTVFGGDGTAAAVNYFENLVKVADLNPAFIGHFDLVTKLNDNLKVIDVNDSRYVKAWKKAADELLKLNVPFEINFGGITRGWKKTTYPAPDMLDYLEKNGAKFILSSDAHTPENIACWQEEFIR